MKTLLLLGLLLTSLLPVDALPRTARTAGPDSLIKMRRHLRHQAKVRLRQYRHR